PPRGAEVQAGVHRDPVEPGAEGAVPAEPVDGAIGIQEDLLGHVVGVLGIVHVAIAEPVDVALVALHETVEGLALAPLAGKDGLAVIHPQPHGGRARPAPIGNAGDKACSIIAGATGPQRLQGHRQRLWHPPSEVSTRPLPSYGLDPFPPKWLRPGPATAGGPSGPRHGPQG